MKFVFRRLLAGIVIVPLVALAYFVFYALLVGLGADPTATPSEVWANGLWLGGFLTIVFAGEVLVRKNG
jgi:hypothetical protein